MRLQQKEYRQLFNQVYGEEALKDPETALQKLAQAVAAFEETAFFSPFTSKFDYYKKGQATLTEEELLGLQLFNDPKKGNCAACHPSGADARTGKILFTDFTYDNIGLPANPEIVKRQKNNYQPDMGLGAIVKKAVENGKFKVPTLRNVALTAPYFHNGVFRNLGEEINAEKGENTLQQNYRKKPERNDVDVVYDPVGFSHGRIDELAGYERENHKGRTGKR